MTSHSSSSAEAAFIAVDWGTTSFRLWLLSANGDVLAERRSREGMTTGAADNSFSRILSSHLEAVSAPEHLPVVICGMAGARQGWIEAGYIDLPARLTDVFDGSVRVPGEARDIRILPGLAQRDSAFPDVMRGEETQLVGTLTGDAGEKIVCMPGTHSKWVRLAGDTVERFSTFMTGELFDVISKHSVLSHSISNAEGEDLEAFRKAVLQAYEAPQSVSNLLFTVRAGQLLFGVDAKASKSALSGYMLGLEIAGGVSLSPGVKKVCLVASGALKDLYETALSAVDLEFETIDADVAVRRGLHAAATHIFSDK